MGLADRDYSRQPTGNYSIPSMRYWSITTWLVVINVAVFIMDNISQGMLSQFGYFSVSAAIYGLQIWRFITFQFLHAGIQHIVYNMLALYFMGPILESFLGARRYLLFYLLCGIAGPLAYIALWSIGFLIRDPGVPLVGASAGIFGVLIAIAVLNPNMRVTFNFIFPMQMRTMALILLGLAVFSILSKGDNAGGEAAHLGGAAMGYLLIANQKLLNIANFRRGPRIRYRP